jgi:hypothetical protein
MQNNKGTKDEIKKNKKRRKAEKKKGTRGLT